jgi:hypothetical protein
LTALRARAPEGVKRPVRRTRDAYRAANSTLRWRYRTATAGLRPLPDFLIVGAQKCGTTSLYEYLAEHPQVMPALTKEVHYFDVRYPRGMSWYRAHFGLRRPGRITGEASPYYLFHPAAPQRIKSDVPRAKLIVMLRDPAERAVSHYHHSVDWGFETLSLEDAIRHEPERLDGEASRIASDPTYRGLDYQHLSYLSRGVYADQLELWLSLFPREQMLVLNSHDFFDDPATGFNRVLDFLELPPQSRTEYPVVAGRTYDTDPAIVAELREYFRPHNQRLYELLGEDFGW